VSERALSGRRGRKRVRKSSFSLARATAQTHTYTQHTEIASHHRVGAACPGPLSDALRCGWPANGDPRGFDRQKRKGGGGAARDTESNRGAQIENAAAQTTRPRGATSERVGRSCELESFVYRCLLRLDCITLRVSIQITNLQLEARRREQQPARLRTRLWEMRDNSCWTN